MTKKLAIIPAMALIVGACEPTVEGATTLREPDSPFIAFNVWVKVGSQRDPAGKEGLAALTANLLADGSTTEDSYDAILAKLYPMAAGYGHQVDKEMTVFRGRVHRDNLEEYYTLFRNALLSPAFSEEDFERVKTRTLNFLERTRRYGRDEELSKELLFWMAYQDTPYQHPEEGYVESVRSITLDDVKAFYAQYYLSNNVEVGLAGGYPRGFVQRVRQDLDALPQGEVVEAPAPEPQAPNGIKILIVEKETDATAISFGFPTSLVRGHEDFWPMVAMNSWFGEHRESFSHIYQVIRETRGMNYGDYSYIEAYPRGYTTQVPPTNVARRSQLFEIWIRPISETAPGNLHDRTLFATRAAWRELKRLVDEGMTEETLGETQQFLENYVLNWGQTVSRRLGYALDDRFYGMEPGYLAAIRPAIRDLTLEQVNAAIRRHLQYHNMWVVFITEDAEGLKRKLVSGVPTFITYAGAKPAELLAEDELIASFPLRVAADDITITGIDEVFER
jgi:zinc protease